MMRFLLFIFLWFFTTQVHALSIDTLIARGQISAAFKTLGGYQRESLELTVINKSREPLQVVVEPGRLFLPPDSNLQRLIAVKTFLLALEPGEEASGTLDAFCANADRAAPAAGVFYTLGPLAGDYLIRLAQLINRSMFPDQAIQAAIWVLTDNHAVSGIYSEPAAAADELRQSLAGMLGLELPWYQVRFRDDSVRVFSGDHELVQGRVSFYLRNNALVKMVVRDSRGVVVKVAEQGRPFGPGEHRFTMNLNVAGWPRGDYQFLIYGDDQLNQRLTFRL